MPPLFKRPLNRENRIENAGRWPVRLTRFHLIDEYNFPATNYPEIFYIQEGRLIHHTKQGKQSVREGFAMVIHPGHPHSVSKPENVVMSRIRFLPEWFTKEYSSIVAMPDVLTLFFDQSWLQFPREDSLHVFNTQEETRETVLNELNFLHEILKSGGNLNPVTRLSMLKLMSRLALDYQRYWRGAGGPKMGEDVRFALDLIERKAVGGEPFHDSALRVGDYDKVELESAFQTFTGITPLEYFERRRIFHAAFSLISTDTDPSQIAKEGGFPDLKRFEKSFDVTFEISPEIYREKFRSLVGPEETAGEENS